MKTKWNIKKPDLELSSRLSKSLDVHPVTAQILVNRGLEKEEDARNFLNPRLKFIPSFKDLPDIDKAIQRILEAIQSKEKIVIYGDYDADGITSAALLTLFFRDIDINVETYIPSRINEGYGLSKKGIDEVKNRGASLIITTDNGSSCPDEISYARDLSIDVIVTDHHEIPEKFPKAVAIVNPKKDKNDTRFQGLAGVGVAFYLVTAIRNTLREINFFKNNEPDVRSYLDLVAIGTIADVMSITGINRILVKNGLEIIKSKPRLGIIALAEASSTEVSDIDSYKIAFRIAPRINASGRLGDQNLALDLLLSNSKTEADELAIALNQLNTKRQSIEKKILAEAEARLTEFNDRSSIVLWSEDWHIGVIGIVASKLAEKYRKPCALISLQGETGRGSIRSINDFNVIDSLEYSSKSLTNFGGHKAAAGFDIDKDKLEEFSKLFEEHISQNLNEEQRLPCFSIESAISLDEINERLVSEIDSLSPFGVGNPKPVLKINPCKAGGKRIVGNNHLKLYLKDKLSSMDAIGFSLGNREVQPGKLYEFAGTPEINEWRGKRQIQLNIKDIKEEE